MTSTYLSRRSSKDVIRGYSDYYGSGKIMDVTCYAESLDGSACGGMISTAYDLYQFIKALFNGTLLSANSIKLMKETVPIPPDDMLNKTIGFDQCGLGIMRVTTPGGHTGWGHSGNMSGFSGQRMCYFPDIDTYFILVTNRGWDNDEIGQLLWPYTWTNIFEKMVE